MEGVIISNNLNIYNRSNAQIDSISFLPYQDRWFFGPKTLTFLWLTNFRVVCFLNKHKVSQFAVTSKEIPKVVKIQQLDLKTVYQTSIQSIFCPKEISEFFGTERKEE